MPSSRASRKGIKWGKTAAASEHRLREEMGLSPHGQGDDRYFSPTERERNKQQRAALRAAFARLSVAERKKRSEEFQNKLRPLCISKRAFVGAWTGSFEPLLEGSSSPTPTDRPATTEPEAGRKSSAKTSQPTGMPHKTIRRQAKLTPDGNMHIAAVEALLRELDEVELETLRGAVGQFVQGAGDDTHKAVKAGVSMIGRALAAELRSRKT